METLHHPYHSTFAAVEKKPSLLTRFFDWAKAQQKYRLGWVAIILAVHGCALTPITVFFIYLGGNNMGLWSLVIGAMGMSVVTNLAALPTKITIPVFFLSILIDLVLIAWSVTQMFA